MLVCWDTCVNMATASIKFSDMAQNNNLKDILANERNAFRTLIWNKYKDDPTSLAHVLLIGECGHGKSAMINTMVKAILGEFYRVADFGKGKDPTKTLHLTTLDNFGIESYMVERAVNEKLYTQDDKKFLSYLPTITDFVGLSNENQDEYKEILKLLVLGYIPPGTSIEYIKQRQGEVKTGNLKSVFSHLNNKWRVTHILFIQSCRTAASTQLARCLCDVLRDTKENSSVLTYNGNVHVMMTKYDLINPSVLGGPTHGKSSIDVQMSSDTADDGPNHRDVDKIEKDVLDVFNLTGNKKYSLTRWVSCCDDVGYDNIWLDILTMKFLYTWLKHPDPKAIDETLNALKTEAEKCSTETGEQSKWSVCTVS